MRGRYDKKHPFLVFIPVPDCVFYLFPNSVNQVLQPICEILYCARDALAYMVMDFL